MQKENCFKNYKLITFFKKSNVFFKTSITSNKVLKKRPLKVTPKRLRIRGKKKFNMYNLSLQKKDKKKTSMNKLKFFRLKNNYYKKVGLSVKFLKSLFLKKNIKKKHLMYFFKNMEVMQRKDKTSIHKTIYLTLLQSHMFFSFEDTKFFLKKGLVYVNTKPIINPMYVLSVGDKVQLTFSKKYFLYTNKVYKFFRKKLKYIRYKR